MKNIKHTDYQMSNISYIGKAPAMTPQLTLWIPRKLAWVIHELWCSVKSCCYSSLPQRALFSTEHVLMFCKSRLLSLINPESSIKSCTCHTCYSPDVVTSPPVPSPACFILALFFSPIHSSVCCLRWPPWLLQIHIEAILYKRTRTELLRPWALSTFAPL